MNLTIQTPMSTSFKANIKSTKYLQKGLKTAAQNIESNPKRAQAFYESLNLIQKNTGFKNFSITAKKGSKATLHHGRESQIKMDKLWFTTGPFEAFGLIEDGEQCVECVIHIANEFLRRKPSKTFLSKDELITESKFWEELILLKKTKTH